MNQRWISALFADEVHRVLVNDLDHGKMQRQGRLLCDARQVSVVPVDADTTCTRCVDVETRTTQRIDGHDQMRDERSAETPR